MRNLLLTLLLPLCTVAEEQEVSVKPFANIQIHAEKNLYEEGTKDNLDTWYGRLNVGADAKKGNLSGLFSIRFYPADFGYDFKGFESQKNVEVPSSIAKIQVTDALVTHEGEYINTTVGRTTLCNSNGVWGGNYIDEGLGGYFTGKGITANFLTFSKEYSTMRTDVTLQANDDNLNKGNLRIWQDISPTEAINLGVGYNSNVFDLIYDEDAKVMHTAAFNAAYTFEAEQKLFVEVGIKDISDDSDDLYIPVIIGASTPVSMIIDMVQAEVEYVDEEDRKRLTAIEETPIQWGIFAQKELNENMAFYLGLQTVAKVDEPSLGARFSAGF